MVIGIFSRGHEGYVRLSFYKADTKPCATEANTMALKKDLQRLPIIIPKCVCDIESGILTSCIIEMDLG